MRKVAYEGHALTGGWDREMLGGPWWEQEEQANVAVDTGKNVPLSPLKEVCFIPKAAGNHPISAAAALGYPQLLSPEYDSVPLAAPCLLFVPLKVYSQQQPEGLIKLRSDLVTCLLTANY